MEYEKFKKDGEVAVLISPGFGAGWHSWNEKYEGLLFDKDIVIPVLEKNFDLARKVAEEKYPEAYISADQLEVVWIEEGTIFDIEEYDGNERIHIIGGREYHIA